MISFEMPRKMRWRERGAPETGRKAASEIGAHGTRERREVEGGEGTDRKPLTALVEQRACAGDVAVRQVLIADGDLDEPLERLALRPRGRSPIGLEELVHFEAEPAVEERRGDLERVFERSLARA